MPICRGIGVIGIAGHRARWRTGSPSDRPRPWHADHLTVGPAARARWPRPRRAAVDRAGAGAGRRSSGRSRLTGCRRRPRTPATTATANAAASTETSRRRCSAMTGHDTGHTRAVRCRDGRSGAGGLRRRGAGPHRRHPFLLASDPFHLGRSGARGRRSGLRRVLRRPVPQAGLEHVAVLETGGGPAVYADWLHAGATAPTVLVYGHHDVQPVDPLEEWTSPPFDPVIVDGECRARGAIDDKGQTLYQIEAARGLLAASTAGCRSTSSCSSRARKRSAALTSSPSWSPRRARLACDVVVVSDTGMIAPDVPSTTVGMRGLVAFDVALRTASIDLHSGMWGGAVPNAALVAARLAAGLARRGRPGHPAGLLRPASGLCRPPSRRHWRLNRSTRPPSGPRPEASPISRARPALAPLERIGVRPTAEVVGLHGGYGGPGSRPSCRPRRDSRWRSGWCPTSSPMPSSRPSGPGWPSGCRPGSRPPSPPKDRVAPALTPSTTRPCTL